MQSSDVRSQLINTNVPTIAALLAIGQPQEMPRYEGDDPYTGCNSSRASCLPALVCARRDTASIHDSPILGRFGR